MAKKKNKRHNKTDDKDLLTKRVSVRFTADDKITLTNISRRGGMTRSAVIRQALYAYYATDFNKR